jgi:hypothetical protein
MCIPKKTVNRIGSLYLAKLVLPTGEMLCSCSPEVSKALTSTKIGYVKGGFGTVKKRRSNLNTGNPFQMELFPMPCERPAVFEKYWHIKYDENRLRGELFDLTDE